MIPPKDPYDTWENVQFGLKAVKRLTHALCEIKPSKEQKDALALWEKEMNEVRKWAISLHYRGIYLNIKTQNENKLRKTATK